MEASEAKKKAARDEETSADEGEIQRILSDTGICSSQPQNGAILGVQKRTSPTDISDAAYEGLAQILHRCLEARAK